MQMWMRVWVLVGMPGGMARTWWKNECRVGSLSTGVPLLHSGAGGALEGPRSSRSAPRKANARSRSPKEYSAHAARDPFSILQSIDATTKTRWRWDRASTKFTLIEPMMRRSTKPRIWPMMQCATSGSVRAARCVRQTSCGDRRGTTRRAVAMLAAQVSARASCQNSARSDRTPLVRKHGQVARHHRPSRRHTHTRAASDRLIRAQ